MIQFVYNFTCIKQLYVYMYIYYIYYMYYLLYIILLYILLIYYIFIIHILYIIQIIYIIHIYNLFIYLEKKHSEAKMAKYKHHLNSGGE